MIRGGIFVFVFLISIPLLALESDNLEPYGTKPQEEFTNRTFYDSENNRYVFEYDGAEKITYSIDLDCREVQKGYINIEAIINGDVCFPIAYGGLKFRTILPSADGDWTGHYFIPVDYREDADVEITSVIFDNDKLTLEYRDIYMDFESSWTIEYAIKGKSLIFHILSTESDALGNYCGLFFDRSLDTFNPRSLILPYTVEASVAFNDKYFYSVYIDKEKSSASDIKPFVQDFSDDSIYAFAESWNWVNSNNEQVPLDEVCYLTVSSHLMDVLPSVNHGLSSTRDMMNDKIVLEFFSTYEDFYGSRFLFADMYYYGFKNILVILHKWQHWGYDVGLPHHFPPAEEYGGPEAFKRLVDFTKGVGWLFAAHENYVMMMRKAGWEDDNKYYDEYYIAKKNYYDDGGKLKRFRFNDGCFPIAADKMKHFAELESTQLKSTYDTNASFLDLNPGNNPRALLQIDLDANNKNSNSFKICVENTKELFQFMRDLHGGPVVGEGGVGWGRFDTFYAGYIDGVDRNTERGNHAFITPEHELRVIKPLQVNYGMGQYDRYFDYGEKTSFEYFDLDLYRVSEIAFGHAGYFNYEGTNAIPHNMIFLKFAREYYLMQQLQKRYLPRDVIPIEILYYDQEQWISQDELILKRRNLEDVLLKIVYSNGLNIWINHKDDDFIWEPDIYNGITLQIPPNGFVALKTSGEIFLACSIKIDNDRVDYVLSDEYIFAENRSHLSSNIGYLSTNGMAVIQKNSYNFFDIHILEGDYIFENITNKGIIGTSTRCHLNIIYKNEKEFILVAPFIFNADSLSINYYNIHPGWLTENGKLPSDINRHIEVYFIEGEEEKPADDISIYSSGSDLAICNIKPWITYLFRFRE